ncbi:MAG: HAD-IIB family hydrolase [Propionibacteriales bacterium]|nr:HAD-IIB family hydrolase [Propionibacteriales bacterium]
MCNLGAKVFLPGSKCADTRSRPGGRGCGPWVDASPPSGPEWPATQARRVHPRPLGGSGPSCFVSRTTSLRSLYPRCVTPFLPHLIALDVDGTLIDRNERISPAVLDAVARARAAGTHIALSTGRSVHGLMPVLEQLGDHDGLGVASNGAVTYAHWPVEILSTVTFDARKAVTMLLERVPDALVAVEVIGRGYRVNRHFPEGEITGEMWLESVDDLVSDPVTRVIIRDPSASAEEFAEMATDIGLHGTNYFVGWTAWLDLAPEDVSKASGLTQLAERLGVDQSDVLAIGDGRNDVEMLRWAGRGVAIGGSPLEVQSAADDVTETVERDGVAVELARHFPDL